MRSLWNDVIISVLKMVWRLHVCTNFMHLFDLENWIHDLSQPFKITLSLLLLARESKYNLKFRKLSLWIFKADIDRMLVEYLLLFLCKCAGIIISSFLCKPLCAFTNQLNQWDNYEDVDWLTTESDMNINEMFRHWIISM